MHISDSQRLRDGGDLAAYQTCPGRVGNLALSAKYKTFWLFKKNSGSNFVMFQIEKYRERITIT